MLAFALTQVVIPSVNSDSSLGGPLPLQLTELGRQCAFILMWNPTLGYLQNQTILPLKYYLFYTN